MLWPRSPVSSLGPCSSRRLAPWRCLWRPWTRDSSAELDSAPGSRSLLSSESRRGFSLRRHGPGPEQGLLLVSLGVQVEGGEAEDLRPHGFRSMARWCLEPARGYSGEGPLSSVLIHPGLGPVCFPPAPAPVHGVRSCCCPCRNRVPGSWRPPSSLSGCGRFRGGSQQMENAASPPLKWVQK